MKRCLVVDDFPVIRKVAKTLLNSIGYEVVEAESGAAGIASCTDQMPDAILLDWDLPDMSGFDFLVAFNRDFQSARRPHIVYATTENDPLDIARAISTGANKYITVPFERDSIENCFLRIEAAA